MQLQPNKKYGIANPLLLFFVWQILQCWPKIIRVKQSGLHTQSTRGASFMRPGKEGWKKTWRHQNLHQPVLDFYTDSILYVFISKYSKIYLYIYIYVYIHLYTYLQSLPNRTWGGSWPVSSLPLSVERDLSPSSFSHNSPFWETMETMPKILNFGDMGILQLPTCMAAKQNHQHSEYDKFCQT